MAGCRTWGLKESGTDEGISTYEQKVIPSFSNKALLNLLSQLTHGISVFIKGVSQVALVVKNPSANAGDAGLVSGSGRSPGGGHGNPFQYSYLENPTDRGAPWARLQRV